MHIAKTIDRRTALKERHRSAIIEAARELVDESGGPGFSVDELAERADVARRTVFNHFASLDEVLLTLCDEALDVLIDDFIESVASLPVGEGTRSSMFEEIAQSIRTADLPSAIAIVGIILGDPDPDGIREQTLTDRAFARAAGRLLQEVIRRNPLVDPFEAEVLVGSLMNGVIVVAKRWVQPDGARLDSVGRARWQALLDQLIESVRLGYPSNT